MSRVNEPLDIEQSVSVWLDGLKNGQEDAPQKLWERYYSSLVRLASRRLKDASRKVSDEDDVAIEAFASFCRGVEEKRFPQLDDRDDLWKVLAVITARKATAQLRKEHRMKRGGGQTRGESVFLDAADSGHQDAGIEAVMGTEPTPESAAQMSEQLENLLNRLGDPMLREIAVLKLAGYGTGEIADQLGCVRRTIERRLELIRQEWSHLVVADEEE